MVTWNVGAGLENRGVIITGAAGGIGRAVADAFGATGAKVLAVDLDQEAAEEVAAGIEGSGHIGMGVDLRDLSTHEELVSTALRELGSLHVLVNLAGIMRRRDNIADVSEHDWDLQHDINLKAVFFLCRAAGAAMIEQGEGGSIITFSSQGWWTGGHGGSVAYAASKGGLVSMTRGFARELGPHRIRVNSVSPGQVHTAMLMTDLPPQTYEAMKAETPLGYVAEPEDMAGTVVFLASDHSAYITGATINISGGFLMY